MIREKIVEVRALQAIFNFRSRKTHNLRIQKKSSNDKTRNLCAQLNPELISVDMFSPTFVPNLMLLTWKISLGMPKWLKWSIVRISNGAEPP